MKKTAFLIFSLLINLSYSLAESDFVERQKYIMGTYITIKLPKEYEELFKPAFDIFKDLDNKLSMYKESSEISRINKNGCSNVSEDTLDILKKAIKFCKETNGYFNIAIGRLTYDVYGFGTGEMKIPSLREVKSFIPGSNCDIVRIEDSKVCVEEGYKIDLGGIGKGYAVDKVAEFLKENGVKAGVILAGGDIRCISECDVLVKNPFKKEGAIIKIAGRENISVSTSGNYERFIKNKKYNHLINPKTGEPEKVFASITLLTKANNTKVDAFATAVAVMPLKQAINFLKKRKDIAGILITNDRKMYITKNVYEFSYIVIFYENLPIETID